MEIPGTGLLHPAVCEGPLMFCRRAVGLGLGAMSPSKSIEIGILTSCSYCGAQMEQSTVAGGGIGIPGALACWS